MATPSLLTPIARLFVIGAAAAVTAASLPAATTVHINQNFDTIADNTALNNAGWYYRHGSNSTTYWPGPQAYAAGTMSGNVLRGGTGSSANSWALTQWAGTTLTNIGDAVSVSFDVSFNLPGRFNVSLFDTGGTAITANSYSTGGIAGGSASVIAGSTGYGYEQTYTSGEPTSAGIVTTTAASNGFDTTTIRSNLVTQPDILGASAFTFSVKLVETGAEISFSDGSSVIASWIDTSVTGPLSFDTLKLWVSATNSSTVNRAIDNVVLTEFSNIPEPSTFASLAGVAALGLAFGRRFRGRR